jgi:hypothetical protein
MPRLGGKNLRHAFAHADIRANPDDRQCLLLDEHLKQ